MPLPPRPQRPGGRPPRALRRALRRGRGAPWRPGGLGPAGWSGPSWWPWWSPGSRPGGCAPGPWLRTAASCTALTALAATSLVAGSAATGRESSLPCALGRTRAHHSEGLDTWNAAYPRPRRALDALMVFLSFPDARPRTTPAELAADYFPATARFYARASYGRFTLRPHPLLTWIRMPQPSTAYRIRRDWAREPRAAYVRDAVAAVDRHVDFTSYDFVYFVADPDAPGVDSDATKVVNFDHPITVDGTKLNRIVTVFEQHPPDRNVLAHETGHVFDLPDLYHRPTDGKGDWDTYVGDWDVMGSQFGLAPDFFGWHKWKLGWLDPRQVVCVQHGGRTQLTLRPLSAPAGGGGARTTAAVRAAGPGGTPGHPGGPAHPAAPDRPQGRTAPSAEPDPQQEHAARTAESGPPARAADPARPVRTARLVVVRTGRTSAVVLEAREAAGNDASACTEGVLVYRVRTTTESGGGPVEVVDAHPGTSACLRDSVRPALADAPVRAGEQVRVAGGGVRIGLAVGRRTAEGWPVTITTG